MNSSRKKIFFGILSLLVLLIICVSGFLYYQIFVSQFCISNTASLYIDTDNNIDSVQIKMIRAANPKNVVGFDILYKVRPFQVKTGHYCIAPTDNYHTVYRKLSQGLQTPIKVTVPSTRTLERMAAILGRRLMCDSIDFIKIFKDTAIHRSMNYDTTTFVCLFIPNTYEMYWDVSVERFIQRMKKEHSVFWNAERVGKAQQIGLTEKEVCTLASIVDEETNYTPEKPNVAGMYINRLKLGMPLQADPTVKFGLKMFGLRRIYNHHLKVKSPYNTYINKGLPPGPIRVATISGIDAVLNYGQHQYLYMCANSDFSGSHIFARTYREHLVNARKYQQALNKRNIK